MIIGLPVSMMLSASRFPPHLQWLATGAGLIIGPALYILIAIGRTGGVDGMPSILDAIVLTFLMSWAVLSVARVAGRRFCA